CERDDDLGFLDLRSELVLQGLPAAACRGAIRVARILVKEVRRALEVLEHAVVVRVADEGMRDEDSNRILLGHPSIRAVTVRGTLLRTLPICNEPAPDFV